MKVFWVWKNLTRSLEMDIFWKTCENIWHYQINDHKCKYECQMSCELFRAFAEKLVLRTVLLQKHSWVMTSTSVLLIRFIWCMQEYHSMWVQKLKECSRQMQFIIHLDVYMWNSIVELNKLWHRCNPWWKRLKWMF